MPGPKAPLWLPQQPPWSHPGSTPSPHNTPTLRLREGSSGSSPASISLIKTSSLQSLLPAFSSLPSLDPQATTLVSPSQRPLSPSNFSHSPANFWPLLSFPLFPAALGCWRNQASQLGSQSPVLLGTYLALPGGRVSYCLLICFASFPLILIIGNQTPYFWLRTWPPRKRTIFHNLPCSHRTSFWPMK